MNSRRIHSLILLADFLWISVALLGSFYLRYPGNLALGFSQPVHGSFLLILSVSLGIWFLLYHVMDLDCFQGGWQLSAMISKTSITVLLHLAAIETWGYSTRLYYPRLVLFYFGILLWAGVILIQVSANSLLRAQARAGRTRKVVVIGDNNLSREVVHRIRRHPELLYEVVGFLSPFGSGEFSNGNDCASGMSGFSSLDALEFLRKLNVQVVIVLPKHAPGIELQNFLVRCQETGILIHLLPQPYELYISRPKLIEIDGFPLVSLEQSSFSRVAQTTKRIFDLVLSLVFLTPAILILAFAGGALWMKKGRFLRKEMRCGRLGRPFAMYRLDIELDDARASKFDKFLHRLSISELPQLFNVLRGQMSLVGPRPESPERVRDYSEWQKQRLKMAPGMTGLAQVNGLREQHPSEEKTRHDLQYTLHWNAVLDLVLLLQTIWTLAGRVMTHRKIAAAPIVESPLPSPRKSIRPMIQSTGE